MNWCARCGGHVDYSTCPCELSAAAMEERLAAGWTTCGGCGGQVRRGVRCGCATSHRGPSPNHTSPAAAAAILAAKRSAPGEPIGWDEAMQILRRKYLP